MLPPSSRREAIARSEPPRSRDNTRTRHRSVAKLLAVGLLLAVGHASTKAEAQEGTPLRCPRAIPLEQQRRAEAALREKVPDLLVHNRPRRDVPRSFYHPTGFLTRERRDKDPLEIARAFAHQSREVFGLTSEDLEAWQETDAYRSEASGIAHLYLRQTHAGIPVYNGQMQVHVDRRGRVLGINSAFVPGLADSITLLEPELSAAEAVLRAAADAALELESPPAVLEKPEGPEHRTILSPAGLSTRPIEARLRWFPPADHCEVRLAWSFEIRTIDGRHAYEFLVDAATGEVLQRQDHVQSAEYLVFPRPVESPDHGDRRLLSDPADPIASRFGWHDLDGAPGADLETLRGNNVHVYPDPLGLDEPPENEISCDTGQTCSFPLDLGLPPADNLGAALTNAFYWANLVHDVTFAYGFDEAGGNFQELNFGRDGAAGDSVPIEVLDGANAGPGGGAYFYTPPDGDTPKMVLQLRECDGCDPKERDSAFDNGIVVHEYAHGISNRLVGGPSNNRCLVGDQQAGEGFSDFLALVFTHPQGADGDQSRGVGNYFQGTGIDGPGFRTQPYSTDPSASTKTYQSIYGLRQRPHDVGEAWAQVLWEAYWALIDRHGFDPDLQNARGPAGNQRMLLYAIQGMANTACQPTFADLRDGILQAAIANHDGEDVCQLWNVFARFGLGVDADSAAFDSTRVRDGYSTPGLCGCVPSPPGLLGWWPMDEPELGKIHDQTDLATGRHGQPGFDVRPGRGLVGSGLVFTGRAGYVQIRGNGRFEGFDETGFTIEAWIQPQAPIVDGLLAPLWHFGDIEDPRGRSIGLYLGVDGSLTVHLFGDEQQSFSTPSDQVRWNRWTHVAATFDGPPTYQNRIWVDGVEAASLEASFRLGRGRNHLRLGANNRRTNAFFRGRMDEVGVYRDARSRPQIRSIFGAQSAGRCKRYCDRPRSGFDRVFQLYENARTATGSPGDDLVLGSPVGDTVRSQGGDDCVFGFEGNDTIRGGDGEDTLFGGEGNDRIEGNRDNDEIHGGEGNDILRGRRGSDEIHGGGGDDEIEGDEGNDQLEGGAGDDNLHGRRGDDRIRGGEGNDEIEGNEGDDILRGGADDDLIDGGDGKDRIQGEAGRDRLRGGPGADVLVGGPGQDFLRGGAGRDRLSGDENNDRLCGEEGADIIDGGPGLDEYRGGAGNDTEVGVETEIDRADCNQQAFEEW